MQRTAGVFYGLVALVILLPASVFAVVAPKVQLQKTVGTGPTCPEPNHSLQVPQGTEVRYCYLVTNTGTVSITEDELHDDVLGDIPGTHVLAPGQSFTETLQQTATVPITNTATITATYSTGVITSDDSDILTITAASDNNVPPGGEVCTGTTTTSDNPVQACATTPQGGAVSITVSKGGCARVPGFRTVDVSANVTAPPATVTNPLVLTFLLDQTQVPASLPLSNVDVFHNGSLVPVCTGAPEAIPDPCVSGRQRLGNGDVQITVLTSSASTWCFEIFLSAASVPLLSTTPQILLIGLLALVGLLGLLRPLLKH